MSKSHHKIREELYLARLIHIMSANKKLYLIRHSYAESAHEGKDFERNLTLRGQSTVRALGRYLASVDFKPEVILCSSSVRTTETAVNLVEELEMSERMIQYHDVIYNASVREMLSLLNDVTDDYEEVAMIGHNPTITFLGEYLSGAAIGNMEPSGVVTIHVDQLSWAEVSQGVGVFKGYYHPDH